MEKTCKIYYTSDTHGRLFPENGVGGRCLTACFAEYQKDENTLVLDGGDTLQGAPLLRYLWKHDDCPKLLAETMNHGQLDYYTLGNHDFNYGYDPLARYVQGVNGSCVCANVQDVRGQMQMADDAEGIPTQAENQTSGCAPKPPMNIRPYAIHTLGNGLRIGIVGIVSEYVNLWEAEENLNGLRITDPFAAAKQALEQLESVENGVDYTICIYHGGFEEDITQIAQDAAAVVAAIPPARVPSIAPVPPAALRAEQAVDAQTLANAPTLADAPAPDCNPKGERSAAALPTGQEQYTAIVRENVGCKICRELGFDLLLTAHQHMEQPLRMLYGTAVLQLPPNAEKYACLEIGVDVPGANVMLDADIETGASGATSPARLDMQDTVQEIAGQQPSKCSRNTVAINMDKSTIAKPRARIIRAAHIAPTTAPDPAFLTQMQPIRTAAADWLAQPAGTLATAIPPETDKIKLALGTAPIAQLANFAQRNATGAEVAITALPNQTVSLPQQLTIGDVLTAYPFPNAVMTLAVRGDVLAQGIARSASYFAKGADGALHVARGFVSPKEEHYNYDFFAGVEYSISFEDAQGGGSPDQMSGANQADNGRNADKASQLCDTTARAHVSQSPTVSNITVNGAPLDPARTYTVAMSDYRATGTGGYDFYAACPRIASYPVDLQALILQTLADHPNLRVPAQSAVHLLG